MGMWIRPVKKGGRLTGADPVHIPPGPSRVGCQRSSNDPESRGTSASELGSAFHNLPQELQSFHGEGDHVRLPIASQASLDFSGMGALLSCYGKRNVSTKSSSVASSRLTVL